MENRRKKIVFEVTVEVPEGTRGEPNIKVHKIETGYVSEEETIAERENVAEKNEILKKLPTVEVGEYAETLSVYTDKDENRAVIPAGWTVSGTKKENIIWGKDKGLVIYKIPKENVMNINWFNKEEVKDLQKRYNQMVWIPVEKLKPNGTIDGKNFTEKFGIRTFGMFKSLKNESDVLNHFDGGLYDPEFELHCTSIKKYGGFWFSRYDISKNEKTGKPYSVRYAEPWISKRFNEVEEFATKFEGEDSIYKIVPPKVVTSSLTSHMIYGAEYDTALEWFIETKTVTFDDIICDSSKWGHYLMGRVDSYNFVQKIAKTGSREKWCANNIYDFTGNTYKWTQENYHTEEHIQVTVTDLRWSKIPDELAIAFSGDKLEKFDSKVIRGGNNYSYNGGPAASRHAIKLCEDEEYICPALRTALYIN